ncbi:hypothetical protein WOLCODRAFT_135952 [Wolfiporia cocos MD-104 SS10]|uniref:Uncharacterized protein n=1 Tax=Wolfiporia cocos (strain MD-104) TaxID=742152 RepID=A0A2H3J7N3_WOLCO|nr:hypothetical protein WOLCODRAFT_135952 [Wolfiporia cocos MD-104 SS10]
MAQPSSSHRERERERERSSSSRHHHHRTISSTTLLLVLSLVLAVLAVMLSLPSQGARGEGAPGGDPENPGILGYFSPKRTQALLARESNVAVREAEVARREAELLAGAPGGVITAQEPIVCPACPTVTERVTVEAPFPAQTVIKEVVKEEALTPPGWWDQARIRAEDILDRELKIAEREREISRREEAVNRREHDASRRESWIMEQLVTLNNEDTMEEEYVYEPVAPAAPPVSRRRTGPKDVPYSPPQVPYYDDAFLNDYNALPPPLVLTETAFEVQIETKTVTHTEHHTVPTRVTVPPPANTRRAASPTPELVSASSFTTHIPRTTAVEVVVEEDVAVEAEEIEEEEEEEEVVEELRPVRVKKARNARPARRPERWWNGW